MALLIGAATLFLFWPATHYDFVNLDDNVYVYDNPHVLQGMNRETIRWAMTSQEKGYWIPLTRLSYLLDTTLFGTAAHGYHRTNIVLHAMNAVLLFLLLARMTGSLWASALASLLFAIHPLRVESVVWITERKDVLCMIFGLLTIGAYVHLRHNPWRLAAVSVFMILSMMAKPLFITLPLLLLLLDWWPLGRIRYTGKLPVAADIPGGSDGDSHRPLWTSDATNPAPSALRADIQLVLGKIPLFLISVLFAIGTLITQYMNASIRDMDNVPLFVRLAYVPILYGAYLWKTIYPVGLSAIYPLMIGISLMTSAMALIGLVGITYAIIRLSKTTPALMVGWSWFLIAFIPMIGFVRTGTVEFADRFTYLPSIGLAVLVAWGLQDLMLFYRLNKTAVVAVIAMVLAVLCFFTHRQIQTWRDGMTLFRHSLTISAKNAFAYNNLGCNLVHTGHYKEALECFDTVLRFNPNYLFCLFNRGSLLRHLGRASEGLPDLVRAVELMPQNATYQFELGAVYAQLGQLDKAIEHLSEAVKLKPDNLEYRQALSTASERQLGLAVRPNEAEKK